LGQADSKMAKVEKRCMRICSPTPKQKENNWLKPLIDAGGSPPVPQGFSL
jgi:hypothetical protein